MNYKLVASDMDGTLINSKDEISDKTLEAIKRAVEKGVIFTVCTGRPIQGVEKYNERLNLNVPFITYNGAMIVMGESKEVLFEQGLLEEDARRVLEIGKNLDTTMIIWSNNDLYVNKIDERVRDYERLSNVKPVLMEDEEEILKQGVTKILWYDDVEKINKYQSDLKDELGDKVSLCTSKPFFLEFFHREVSKGVAIEKLGEHFGIKKEEIIAIGDGFNDFSMLQCAGLGIAMGNAPDGVKEVADYVTLSCDDEGVAYALDKFVI